MDIFNQCGELCQEYGMKFGYHNHDFEFYTKLDGEVMYDIILDNTDPNLVTQQMDIGNKIGRASCRERVWIRVSNGAAKNNTKENKLRPNNITEVLKRVTSAYT